MLLRCLLYYTYCYMICTGKYVARTEIYVYSAILSTLSISIILYSIYNHNKTCHLISKLRTIITFFSIATLRYVTIAFAKII